MRWQISMQRQEYKVRQLPMFVVDRTVPGMTEELLAEQQRLLHEAARRVSLAGQSVRYVRCTYIPDEDRCICLFEADNVAAVRRVNETAQVPFRRISAAVEFWEPGAGVPKKKSQ